MRSKYVGDLLNFFRQIINAQKTINLLKKDILEAKGFSLKALFRHISKGQSVLSIKSIKNFLDNKVACNQRQLYDLFQRFDHHRCGFVSLEDFITEMVTFLPKKKAKKIVEKSHGSVTCESQFRTLLSVIIRTCRVLDIWRKQLQPVTPYIIFEDINRFKTGVISKRELFRFFYENSRQLNQEDSQLLYSSLLRRHYRQLNLQIFCENLKPLEFGYYQAFRYYLNQDFEKQLNFKEKIAKQAVEVQQNYLKQRRNQEITKGIHEEAALNRQRQLELRVQDQLKAYRELKYQTKKKFHPELTFEEFMYSEKENQMQNLLQIKMLQEKERLNNLAYMEKMRNISTLREVQQFEKYQKGSFLYPRDIQITREPLSVINQQELEKRIRNHAYSARNADDLLMKRQVARNLQQYSKVL